MSSTSTQANRQTKSNFKMFGVDDAALTALAQKRQQTGTVTLPPAAKKLTDIPGFSGTSNAPAVPPPEKKRKMKEENPTKYSSTDPAEVVGRRFLQGGAFSPTGPSDTADQKLLLDRGVGFCFHAMHTAITLQGMGTAAMEKVAKLEVEKIALEKQVKDLAGKLKKSVDGIRSRDFEIMALVQKLTSNEANIAELEKVAVDFGSSVELTAAWHRLRTRIDMIQQFNSGNTSGWDLEKLVEKYNQIFPDDPISVNEEVEVESHPRAMGKGVNTGVGAPSSTPTVNPAEVVVPAAVVDGKPK